MSKNNLLFSTDFGGIIVFMIFYISADLGGIIGLFLGGSAISVFEIFDVFLYNLALHIHYKLKKRQMVSPKSSFEHIQLHNTPSVSPSPPLNAWKT